MVTTTSMPFPALEPTSCPTAAASSLQTSRSSADAEARHLAAAVARGDEAAFRQLYDRYQPRLFRLALVLGRGDELLAQDTVQSVFVTQRRNSAGLTAKNICGTGWRASAGNNSRRPGGNGSRIQR